jgi:uncharacterized membrane protein YgcG
MRHLLRLCLSLQSTRTCIDRAVIAYRREPRAGTVLKTAPGSGHIDRRSKHLPRKLSLAQRHPTHFRVASMRLMAGRHVYASRVTVGTVLRGALRPEAASARRRPLYIVGAVGLVLAAVAIVIMIMAQEGWAAFGMVIFLAGSVAAFIWGYMIPNTTVEGEIASARWRGYRASVSDRAYQPNLDTDLPYIVAMGLLGKMSSRLKAASESGYSPSWFRAGVETQDGQRVATTTGFYPYWIVFHSSMSPVTSGGSASGGYSGGGAAGGGGGSAGSF